MTTLGEQLAEQIVEQLDTDPPTNVDPHPELFDDLEDDRLSSALFKLWQKGLLDAKYEDGETKWWLTEFGVELVESGLYRVYIRPWRPTSRSRRRRRRCARWSDDG